MHVVVKRDRRIPELVDSIEWFEAPREPDFDNVGAECAPIRDYIDVTRSNICGS